MLKLFAARSRSRLKSRKTVGDLKKAILQENPNDLKDIDAARLVLYRVDLRYGENLEDTAKQATEGLVPLKDPLSLLSEIFLTAVPSKTISIVVEDPKIRENVAEVSQALNSELVKEYKDIFINVSNWADFEDADILRQSYCGSDSGTTICYRLYSACECISGQSLAAAYDRINEAMDIDHGPPEESISDCRSLGEREVPRHAQGDEMSHVVYIMSDKWPGHQQRQQNRNDAFKERVAQMIFFGKLYYYVQGQRTITAHLMLLAGAAVVRFANKFLESFKGRDFVLVAVYITSRGVASRYTIFQDPDDPNSPFVFSFGTSDGRIEFARQLYNLNYMLEGANEGKDTETNVDRFKEKILIHSKKFILKSMFSKGTKKNADKTDDGAGTGGGRGAGAGSADAADHMEFRAHGYEVEPEVVVDNRDALAHTQRVSTVEPENVLIAKKVREESKEIAIFNLLDSIQSKSKHIISLLDFVPYLVGDVAQVCKGLIEGLASSISISPLQVKDENEEVDGECGTKHWMAPEIGKSWYSPIKADRWSCGHVILHLLDAVGKEDNQWKAIARRLEAHDPDKRPSLLEWPSWFAPPLSNVVNIAGEIKALRHRQGTLNVDGENAMPLQVKKQRLTEFDRNEGGREFGGRYEPQASQPVVR
ncbi:hypothetical protein F5148DRAFT_1365582, partial [Russula earlei]